MDFTHHCANQSFDVSSIGGTQGWPILHIDPILAATSFKSLGMKLLAVIHGSEPRTLLTRMIQSAFPQWSPDGKRIVTSTRRKGEPWRVSMINMTDFSMEEITDTSINSLHPSFSPDGSHVVFGNIPSVDDVAHPLRLFMLDVSTKIIEAIPGQRLFLAKSLPWAARRG